MMVALERFVRVAALLVLIGPAWGAASALGSARTGARTAADAAASRFCPDVDFVAYSTLEPSGQRVEESFSWDDADKAYLVRGPRLAYLLNDPGVATLPDDDAVPQMSFRIAIRASLSSPVDRFCQQQFQEQAECDPSGTIIYTQIYTSCDLQRIRYVTRITPDRAGSLQLLELSFSDVQGNFSAPLFLSANSDLRINR